MAKDLFSHNSEAYSKYRPTYPKTMIDSLVKLAPSNELAIDFGAGNGQATRLIAPHFENIIAVDHSASQLDQMPDSPNLKKVVSASESIEAQNNSVDLLIVAQALHWFNHQVFYKEVERCLKPGGIFAYWGYNLLLSKNKVINQLVQSYYNNVIGSYWPPERRLLEKEYETIKPSNLELINKTFYRMKYTWTPKRLEGYLNTWSSTKAFIDDQKYNPVNELMEILNSKFEGKFDLEFPIFLWIWRKPT